MSLVSIFSPLVTSVLTSPGLKQLRRKLFNLKRQAFGGSHQVLLFYKVNDPYSYLLLQFLEKLTVDFDVSVKLHLVSTLNEAMFPEPGLLDAWSLQDAQFLAQTFGLEFPSSSALPDASLCLRAEKLLVASNHSSEALSSSLKPISFALEAVHAIWRADEAAIAELENELRPASDEQRQQTITINQQLLEKKGHYLSATLYYDGEWYWGLDRIVHLATRLNDLKLGQSSLDLTQYDYPLLSNSISNSHADAHSLDFYFSFRSPYSYLACQRLKKLSKQHHLSINVKPVLPMVMRGLAVPRAKKQYIFLDTKRECERYHIDFGKIVDPLGEGVNRCMAIFPYAARQGLALDYVSVISRGIWAEGKDVAQDKVLQALVEKAGLNWQEALPYLENSNWKNDAKRNRDDMMACGFWGVPSFQYKEHCFWGQDRLWAIENLIKRTADNAELISVYD